MNREFDVMGTQGGAGESWDEGRQNKLGWNWWLSRGGGSDEMISL